MNDAMTGDPLLRPFRLRHLTLKNRIVSTAHEPDYTEDGMPKERYRLYHEEKAKGGIALSFIGGSTLVSPDNAQVFGNIQGYRSEVVRWYRELSDALHSHDCAVMTQLTHMGRRSSAMHGEWLPLVAASPVREQAHRSFPKEAESHDLRRIARDFRIAAEYCRQGGLDGIEIEAYSHLIDGFWSPITNRRKDEYGVGPENRLRFAFEVLNAIRAGVGSDYIVGIRLVLDETLPGGLNEQDGFSIAKELADSGLVDFFNVIRGHMHTNEGMSHTIPAIGTPAGPHLDIAKRLRHYLDLPVLHAGRINDIATARHAIAEGYLDLVGMTRAHMADPHIVNKIMAGKEDEIRPCVSASYCLERPDLGADALCIHNPATGRERRMPHVLRRDVRAPRKIVVIGAGPAGLEMARVCATRGHEVVLYEAAARAGGQVLLASAHLRRRELIGIVDWRMQQCEKQGVVFHFNSYAGGADVLRENPDVVIVATGGLPDTSFLEAGGELVTTTWDILSRTVPPGKNVLLFDDNGAHPAMTAMEYMAEAGSQIELVTPERAVAIDVGGLNYSAYFRAMGKHRVKTTLFTNLRSVRRDGNMLEAELVNFYSRSSETRKVDQVVVEHGTLPVDEVYFELKSGSTNLGETDLDALIEGRPQTVVSNPDGRYQLFRVGDSVASRNVHAAIYDALRLGVML